MWKRFLQACKNPLCSQEFGILYEKVEEGGIKTVRCPHCKRLHKVKLPGKIRMRKIVKKKTGKKKRR